MGWIIWGDAYLDLVSNHNLDSVHFYSPGKTTQDNDIVIAMNFHDSTAQHLGDLTL